MSARCIMVLGTTSGAGKSWLATALCRHYQRLGLRVAPFKAQNMSNNARVVGPDAAPLRGSLPPEGTASGLGAARQPNLAAAQGRQGEIGSAQYFQALAARAVPDVRMNPLLLKPEHDTHSQVVLMGQVSEALSRLGWRERSEQVWPHITRALDQLRAEHDVIVIEGAGSPVEINLHDSDIVNMRVALHCHAACLLVTDIDRGGAFAHLYGTWALLPEAERALIRGFVLNKFRGDAALLAPAPQMLQDLTGVPTMAVLPMWWQHGLPEEDGVFDMTPTLGTAVSSLPPEGALAAWGGPAPLTAPTLGTAASSLPPEGALAARGGPAPLAPLMRVCIVAYPRISNLDEYQPLKNVPGVCLHWVRSPGEISALKPTDWIILPGSKATSADLAWLRSQGLDAAVARHAGQGGAVLGICGGLQMLGEALIDPHGLDGNAPGLGLLPLVTVFAADKTVRHTRTRFAAHMAARGPWAALAGIEVAGYEIHHGQTQAHAAMQAAGDVALEVLPDALGWQNPAGNVLGLYLHGLFEDPAALQALMGAHRTTPVPALDSVFDALADFIEQHFAAGTLAALLEPPATSLTSHTS